MSVGSPVKDEPCGDTLRRELAAPMPGVRSPQPPGSCRIAVASGKGGAGKTTVAVSLAAAAAELGMAVTYADCDVEEPNGHIFLKPELTSGEAVNLLRPVVDERLCTRCGKCADICNFGAIAAMPEAVLLFPELCHSCGGCMLVCPEGAIEESAAPVGAVESGTAGPITFIHGLLDIGQARATPLIGEVKRRAAGDGLVILDSPPGTACPFVETVSGCDLVLLVTEPTPFGLNDLELAVETVRRLGLPWRVMINRADPDAEPIVEHFCARGGGEIIARLPDDRRIAEACSDGKLVYCALEEYRGMFVRLLEDILSAAAEECDRSGAGRISSAASG